MVCCLLYSYDINVDVINVVTGHYYENLGNYLPKNQLIRLEAKDR